MVPSAGNFPIDIIKQGEELLLESRGSLLLNSLSGRSALNQCCISKCRVGAPQSVNNGVCQNDCIGKCISRCHQVAGNASKKDNLNKIIPTTCCSARELQTAELSKGTARNREWNFTALRGNAVGLYPIFLSHGALLAWQSRDSLQSASCQGCNHWAEHPCWRERPFPCHR